MTSSYDPRSRGQHLRPCLVLRKDILPLLLFAKECVWSVHEYQRTTEIYRNVGSNRRNGRNTLGCILCRGLG